MTRFTSWLLVLLLFAGFVATAIVVLRARIDAGKGMPEFSVYSEERNGLGEVARLVRRIGWQPVALTRPVNAAFHRGLLITVEPGGASLLPGDDHDLGEPEASGLLRWVEDGNTLLVCGRSNSALSRALDVMLSSEGLDEDETPHLLEPDDAGRYTDDLDRIEVEGRHALQADRGLVLWRQDNRTAAIMLRHGSGRVIYIADPSFLTRRRLHRGADNLVFLANVAALYARDGRIYFDEYHHGIRSSGGFWGYLGYHGQRIALIPVLLAVLVGVWAVAVRLGPARAMPRGVHADAVDYASAAARIYQRAGARRLVARTAARTFLTALARHLRIRRGALPAEMLAAWRDRHPKESTTQLESLLRGANDLRKTDLGDRQLLAWTRAFDQFEKEQLVGPAAGGFASGTRR
jgi:hypothetical protein